MDDNEFYMSERKKLVNEYDTKQNSDNDLNEVITMTLKIIIIIVKIVDLIISKVEAKGKMSPKLSFLSTRLRFYKEHIYFLKQVTVTFTCTFLTEKN